MSERCPLCDGRVLPKAGRPHDGLPRCQRCGAIEIEPSTWVYECEKCRKRGTELHGYMVPHLCQECFERVVKFQTASGLTCPQCGKARIACPH